MVNKKEINSDMKHISKQTFVTLFARGEDLHLVKDVGMIPYLMAKNYNYDSYLVCYQNSEKYSNLKITKDLKIEFLKKKSNKYIDSIIYLLKNSKKIDVLNLYHMRPYAQIMIILYKMLNKKGKVYLKLDSSYVKFRKNAIINNKFLVSMIIKKCTLVSCESSEASKLFKKDGLNVEYIPNGFIEYSNYNNSKKKYYILTVGRLGTEQKATEILLDSFKLLKEKYKSKYELYLIGSMEEKFKSEFELFLKKNPKISKDIHYIGQVTDKKKLDKYYNECKVFCLPSRYESFGLVLVEAMAHGCYIVTTQFGLPVRDIVANKKIGKICKVNNVDMIAKSISEYEKTEDEFMNYRINFANKNFEWNKIVKFINDFLEK